MIQSKDRRISNPLFGLLLGLAAFFLAVLPEIIMARFASSSFFLMPMLFFIGLILLKLFVGPQLDSKTILISGVASFMFLFFSVFLTIVIGFAFLGFDLYGGGDSVLLIFIVFYGSFGFIFGQVNFGIKAMRIFLPVFLVFPLTLIFIALSLQLNGTTILDKIDLALNDGTSLEPAFVFIFVTLGALFGLSIGLYNKFILNDKHIKADPDPPEQTDQAENKLPGKETD